MFLTLLEDTHTHTHTHTLMALLCSLREIKPRPHSAFSFVWPPQSFHPNYRVLPITQQRDGSALPVTSYITHLFLTVDQDLHDTRWQHIINFF